MQREPRSRLVLWGCGTSRTFRPHFMLAELGLEYDKRLIGSRTGETVYIRGLARAAAGSTAPDRNRRPRPTCFRPLRPAFQTLWT